LTTVIFESVIFFGPDPKEKMARFSPVLENLWLSFMVITAAFNIGMTALIGEQFNKRKIQNSNSILCVGGKIWWIMRQVKKHVNTGRGKQYWGVIVLT